MSKKNKEDEVANSVLNYINSQNRPYSAGDVFSNLHGQFGKTAVQKALDLLTSQDKINEKIYGKQKVYGPKQSQYGDYNEDDLRAIDDEVRKCEKQCSELENCCKTLEEEYRILKNSLTTEEATTKLNDLNEKISKNKEQLKRIKSASVHITPSEKDKIIKNHKSAVQVWRKRKRMATDIMDGILESYPKTKKEFIEDVGIETDEEYNVKIPEIS